MAKSEKLDLYKLHKAEYAARRTPALVTVGGAKYLAIPGRGEPGGEEFTAKVGALYGAAFTIKMTRKFAGQDYKVCGLEGLWWASGEADFLQTPREQWRWKLLIRVPEFIQQADLDSAKEALAERGKGRYADEIALEVFEEGPCVQALHVGPYATEPTTIEAMAALARQQGMCFRGQHHEMYLSDPRRVPPERLKTVLRHPVQPAAGG